MIKCGVCGSENEAAALFCGTCGSPLNPAEGKAIADEAIEPTPPEGTTADDAVVPGKGGARRDLGIGGGPTTAPPPDKGAQTEVVIADQETSSGGPTIVCAVCGTVNDATRTYCRKCANELKPAAAPPPPPLPPPAPRRISPLAIGLGAAAAVVAIALVGVLVLGGPGPSAAPSAASSTTPTGQQPTAEASVVPTPTARAFTEGEPSGLIAFARCPANGGACLIYVRPADGSAMSTRLTSSNAGSAFDPSLSHDRTRVLYSVDGLRIVNVESKKFVQHSTNADDSDGAWSSDDTQIIYAGHRNRDPGNDDDDFEIRIDGVAVPGSSLPLTANDILDYDPDFTPDDSSVVFAQGRDNESELMLLDVATKEITTLTTDEFEDEDPAVSPDGTEVVFASRRGDTGGFDLFLLNLATLEITALPTMEGDEHDPAWSPGGRYIVFSGGEEGAEDLFILDLADGEFIQHTDADGADLTPSWQ